MTGTVDWVEFDELRSNVSAIKDTLDNHVLSTLAEHGERLGGIYERLGGLESELHLVKDGVDAIRSHFGI